MRHIILEGPDGGGKSRLAEALQAKYGFEMGPKASHSLRGPVKNLAAWVVDDIKRMDDAKAPLIYDRHPVISEPIYGPLARGAAQPGFTASPWLTAQRLALYSRTVVIWCIPTLEQCKSAVDPARDMPGVVDNIGEIYEWYRYASKAWGGLGTRYDLTCHRRDVLESGLFAGAVQFVDGIDYFVIEKVLGAKIPA